MWPGAQTVEIAWLNVLFGVRLETMKDIFEQYLSGDEVDFCMVDDPFASLNRGFLKVT